MKSRIEALSCAILAIAVCGAPATAVPGPQRIAVPLSQPGKPARLEVSLIQGGVEVEGYEGKEVVVEARPAAGEREHEHDHDHGKEKGRPGGDGRPGGTDKAAGMRRIPNDSFGLSVEEHDNKVTVSADSWRVATDLRILVPASSSLDISLVNEGDVEVEGITGDLELSNVNGSITVSGAAGNVLADTVNGEIQIDFARLTGSGAMAFTSLNGDVDVTFPGGLAANVQLQTDNGEIYSDFEFTADPAAPRVKQEKTRGDKGYRVVVESGVRGSIGGGGREIQMKTFNGNIYLRRAR